MLTTLEISEDTTTEAKALVESFVEAVIIGGNIEQIPQFVHESVSIHSVTGVRGKGLNASKDAVTIWINAFDIVENECLCSLTSADRVLNQWKIKANHVGDFLGVSPSGKEITFTGVTIYQVKEDKIIGLWGYSDFLMI